MGDYSKGFKDCSKIAQHVRASLFPPPYSPSHTFCPWDPKKWAASFPLLLSPFPICSTHLGRLLVTVGTQQKSAVLPPPGKWCFIMAPTGWQARDVLESPLLPYCRDKLYFGSHHSCRKCAFFQRDSHKLFSFFANNSLACSSSSSPFSCILTVAGRYHQSLCKGTRFPRQFCQQSRGSTKSHSRTKPSCEPPLGTTAGMQKAAM